jgi:hypothetical protein
MSQIFLPTDDGFDVQPLDAERYRIVASEAVPPRLEPLDAPVASADDTLIVRVAELPDAPGVRWALVAGRGARVLQNGDAVVLGLALLRHKDELRVGGAAPLYFSSERLAAVEPCARDDAPRCPRCAHPIARGEAAVRCPGCGVLHHELAERPCWTHLPRCALCPQATALDADFTWTPEGL